MYYYPRIPKSFSPSPFSHKIYDNTAIEKMFYPSMTPQPQSPTNRRKRSYSTIAKSQATHIRSRSTTKPLEDNFLSRSRIAQMSPGKSLNAFNKAAIHYMGSESKSSSAHCTIQMNLEEYFNKTYFSKLTGVSTKQLYEKIEPYIKQIVLLNQQNMEIQQSWIPTQYQGITTKEKLVASIKKLEKINRKQFIKELIIYYCILPEMARKQILFNLIADIHLKLRHKTFMDHSFTSYCLITSKGKVASDLLKISPFTQQLIFSDKNSSKDDFLKYKQIKGKKKDRENLFELIKTNFRERIKHVSEEEHKPEKIKIFEKRIEKQTISIVSRRRKLPAEFKNPKNRKDEKSVLIFQIKQTYQIPTKQAKKFVEQFYALITLNSRYTDYERGTQQSNSLVPFENFKQNCVSLQGKQTQNIDNILKHMEYDNIESLDVIKYVEFRLIVECEADPSKILRFLIKFLALDVQRELTKDMLMEALKITLRQYKIPRSNRVIIDILWLQFKRSNIIQYVYDKQLLTITRFKQNYIMNKTLYVFLMTIIFCTKDPLQEAYQVLP